MNIPTQVMQYLRERQTPLIRTLHITIILLVLSQILVSNFMGFSDSGEISSDAVEFYGTWLHIVTGILLIPIAITFLVVELRRYGFKHFFPYLSGEFTQLGDDIRTLLKFRLPEPASYGIAAIIQGLGLGAIFLVLSTGSLWFIAWNADLSWAHDVKELHELFTGLVEAYVIGHGGMGVLHIILALLKSDMTHSK